MSFDTLGQTRADLDVEDWGGGWLMFEMHVRGLQQGWRTCCLRFHTGGDVADGRQWVFLPHVQLQSQVQVLAAS
jgi:hypothetical protein